MLTAILVLNALSLGAILEDILAPDQYAHNIKPNPNSGEIVEYAVRLPGQGDDPGQVVWLPIDAKFPKEDYERLVDAPEAALPLPDMENEENHPDPMPPEEPPA